MITLIYPKLQTCPATCNILSIGPQAARHLAWSLAGCFPPRAWTRPSKLNFIHQKIKFWVLEHFVRLAESQWLYIGTNYC